MSTFKKCNHCKKELEITSFNQWKNGKYLSNCILCNKRKLLSKNKKSKICKKCLLEKPYDQFIKTAKIYSLNCLECSQKCIINNTNKRKLKYYNQKEEFIKSKVENSSKSLLSCTRCKQLKLFEFFRKRKTGEYYKQCMECNKKISKNKFSNRKKKENEILNDESNDKEKKKCFQCFKFKLLIEFNKNKKIYTKYCSKCLNENLLRNKKRKENNSLLKDMKKCPRCLIDKPLESYKLTKKGLQKQCEECCTYYRKLRENNRKKRIICQNILNEHQKQCTRCLNVKNLLDFKTNKNKHCIECSNYQYEYLLKNKCEHGCLNKSACVKCFGGSVCEHKRKKNDCKHCNFHGYLYNIVRKRISSALKKGSKTKRSIEYLCCDINTFKAHIENKFLEGMNWENYGKIWHVDHIIPINYKNPTLDEVIKRLHYLNTQPLWASENIIKGNRYIG